MAGSCSSSRWQSPTPRSCSAGGGPLCGRLWPRSAVLTILAVLLLLKPACGSQPVSVHPDLQALLALKASLCSDPKCLPSWTAAGGDPCASFDGVYCNGQQRVADVHLQLNSSLLAFNDSAMFRGSGGGGELLGLPLLTQLAILCIGPLGSPGPLPPHWFPAYPALAHLRLAACGVQGSLPAALTSAQQLQTLALPRNQLTGELPAGLTLTLTRLQVLDLSGNQLQGPLPSDWPRSPLLSYLYLENNNFSGPLPCTWGSFAGLKLADISGNALLSLYEQPAAGGLQGAPRCWLRSYCYNEGAFICLKRKALQPHAAAAAAGGPPGGSRLAGWWRAAWQEQDRSSSSSSSSNDDGSSRSTSGSSSGGSSGWWEEPGLARSPGAATAAGGLGHATSGTSGCLLYIHGSSDDHIDPRNTCDHGGAHLAAVATLWAAFLLALLLMWVRAWRWSHYYGPSGRGSSRGSGGGGSSSRGLTAAAAGAAGDAALRAPLLQGTQAWSPPLVGGFAAGGPPHVSSSSSVPASWQQQQQRGPYGSFRYQPPSLQQQQQQQEVDAVLASRIGSRSPSDHLPSALTTLPFHSPSPQPLPGPAAAVAGPSPAPGPLPLLGCPTPTPHHQRSRQQQQGYSSHRYHHHHHRQQYLGLPLAANDSWFQFDLLAPPLVLVGETCALLRLLLWWGLVPPAVKLWPSYALLGLLLLPHVLVAVVVHFRLVAAACLPPALAAASPAPLRQVLPPGAGTAIACYSWLATAPCWVAYPAMLLLLVPCVVVLSVLCPLTLGLHLLGFVTKASTVRYLQLLQACAALSQSPAAAVLLTVLFVMGNTPLEWAYLDGSLYYITLLLNMANMLVAWAVALHSSPAVEWEEDLRMLGEPPGGLQ